MKKGLNDKINGLVDKQFAKMKESEDLLNPKSKRDTVYFSDEEDLFVSVDLKTMREIRQKDYMKVFCINILNA